MGDDSGVLAREVIAWTKKYERLRLLLTAELGLPAFDDLQAAVERGRQQGWRDAIAALRGEAARAATDPPGTTTAWAVYSTGADYLTSVAPTEGSQTSAD